MRKFWRSRGARLALAGVVLCLLAIGFRNGGSFLVADNRQKSDAIVITQADSLDDSYAVAMQLLADGYGRELLLDARSDRIFFGRSQADWAAEFIAKTNTEFPGQVKVCRITSDTTAQEIYEVGRCLDGRSIRSVLLVVHDYHCRRSLTMFSRLLPQYRWSIAAVPDSLRFGHNWWEQRTWIRTTLIEWQHYIWWKAVDRWRYAPAN